jgi:hypothetical protein
MLRSFTRSDASTSSEDTVPAGNVPLKKLEDVVGDLSSFRFDDGSDGNNEPAGIARMKLFDEALVLRVTSKFFGTCVPCLPFSYKIKDEVALTTTNSALMEVELFLGSPLNAPVMSGWMRLKFVPGHDKLQTVSWHTLTDALADGSFAEGLQGQVSHPSVVSLEPHASSDDSKNEGPGMNI